MLSFFRHYQKIIFLGTTIVVVSSFAFFGTYRAFTPTTKHIEDKVLYTTLRGRKITENYLEKMRAFLEKEPSFSYDMRKVLDSNPLNDGVLSRDFLIQDFADLLLTDAGRLVLEKKFQTERAYSPYTHPLKKELSALATWQQYAPELLGQLSRLKQSENATSMEALGARSLLYLTHQRFNGEMLKQILRYQEYQMDIGGDPLLMNKDLSLFGYHHVSDWFGEEFTTRAAKVIIHGAQLAKIEGLKVSKEEVLADLQGRAQSCYANLQKREAMPVKNGTEWMNLLLNRLQMEEKDLVQIWEDVLYFRRLLDHRSSSVVIDSLPMEEFTQFAQRALTLKMTKMGEEFAFHSAEDLKGFELYLERVGEQRADLLALPMRFRSSESIAERAPELLGRRYGVTMAHINKSELSAKVPLSQLWAWQESHYTELQENFALPEFAYFDGIDEALREQVDGYSYARIIEAHPEWIKEALAAKEAEDRDLFVRFSQKGALLPGIKNGAELQNRLDQEAQIALYSQDGENFYRFHVTEKGPIGEILSYKEAKELGAIEELTDRLSGDKLLTSVLTAIEGDLRGRGVAVPVEGKELFCVQRRFYRYLTLLQQDPEYREGMSSLYSPFTTYKTIGRSDANFQKANELAKGAKLFAFGERDGLFFYEVDAEQSAAQLPLEKMLLLQQLVSRDVRRALVKEIVEGL